ncbi:Retrovirus-related Pol polyprotein from transposon RE1 [Vitis vinifera]|uniref:Retrovirus-related Pol polyprotein from transposon RE1 n=1 Tax=Vitis vinifera TaxID=29760 RepID=A0A438FR49_VITVI|nr:Retrovirus-related Pol polyprotein from transposon RE1 [Vitis vinifera]
MSILWHGRTYCKNMLVVPKRPTQQDDIPQALAALTLDNTIAETEWTSDTGASNHMTGKQGMLTNIRNYSGSDSVLIGDGSSLPILGIGDSSIKQRNKVLPLHDVLLVPHLKKNLLSERQTGHPMITGRRKGDLYVLPNSSELYFSHRFKSGSADIWHQRLRHPQFSALQFLKNKGLIDVIFNKKIKVFHSDGGGEFINFKLSSHFLSTGIIHQWSSSVSMGRSFFHCCLPNKSLASFALNSETPYFALHGTHPDYTSLRVFGSKCFPYTWDTRQHKFDPKTVLCIFVGYSDKHKGYKCFHPSSKKFFISRHVVF